MPTSMSSTLTEHLRCDHPASQFTATVVATAAGSPLADVASLFIAMRADGAKYMGPDWRNAVRALGVAAGAASDPNVNLTPT